MSKYRYQFRKYKSPSDRLNCPYCGHKRTFTAYIDVQTGQQLPLEYGRCERVNNCGYELNPYKNGYAKAVIEAERGNRPVKLNPKQRTLKVQPTSPPKPMVFIPNNLKDSSLKSYHQNSFVKYLHTLFDVSDIETVIALYQLGTSIHWKGSAVFWFIDIDNNVRVGQIKDFDQAGHTIIDLLPNGEKKSRITWVHTVLKYQHLPPQWLTSYLDQENKVSCLFGEHLLKQNPTKTVCLVEAPKTAVIASLYFPQFVWLAVGALNYLTPERCKVLTNRRVILWPDLKAFEKWQEKVKKLNVFRWKVSDFLEKVATEEERNKGLDLADYLTRENYKDFRLGYPHQWNQVF